MACNVNGTVCCLFEAVCEKTKCSMQTNLIEWQRERERERSFHQPLTKINAVDSSGAFASLAIIDAVSATLFTCPLWK